MDTYMGLLGLVAQQEVCDIIHPHLAPIKPHMTIPTSPLPSIRFHHSAAWDAACYRHFPIWVGGTQAIFIVSCGQ